MFCVDRPCVASLRLLSSVGIRRRLSKLCFIDHMAPVIATNTHTVTEQQRGNVRTAETAGYRIQRCSDQMTHIIARPQFWFSVVDCLTFVSSALRWRRVSRCDRTITVREIPRKFWIFICLSCAPGRPET